MKLNDEEKARVVSLLKEKWHKYISETKSLKNDVLDFKEKIDNLPTFVEETNREFEEQTKLTSKDITVLMMACIMQATRVIVLKRFKERLSDQESANKTPGHKDEHSARRVQRYYASIDEIRNNPVPYDCVQKEEVVKRNGNPKLSGLNHRYKAIGHDPYLGFVFGTANIMTNTITITNGGFAFSSYHVHTGIAYNGGNIDKICAAADTSLIFSKIIERIQSEKKDGYAALGYALLKEFIHLKSDIRTSKSLPIPLVSAASPDFSRILGYLNIDYLNVRLFEKEAGLSILINTLIKFLHMFLYDENKDGDIELYKIRTTKIIGISNEIVTACDFIVAAVRFALGDEKAITKIDWGGTVVTLWHIANDPITIAKIKHEYLISQTTNYLKI